MRGPAVGAPASRWFAGQAACAVDRRGGGEVYQQQTERRIFKKVGRNITRQRIASASPAYIWPAPGLQYQASGDGMGQGDLLLESLDLVNTNDA